MQIDKEKLQKLLNLSDGELKQKIADAVNSSSFEKKDKENLDKAVKNIKDLKSTLANIDEESIKKAMDAMGREKIEEIKKNLIK